MKKEEKATAVIGLIVIIALLVTVIAVSAVYIINEVFSRLPEKKP